MAKKDFLNRRLAQLLADNPPPPASAPTSVEEMPKPFLNEYLPTQEEIRLACAEERKRRAETEAKAKEKGKEKKQKKKRKYK